MLDDTLDFCAHTALGRKVDPFRHCATHLRQHRTKIVIKMVQEVFEIDAGHHKRRDIGTFELSEHDTAYVLDARIETRPHEGFHVSIRALSHPATEFVCVNSLLFLSKPAEHGPNFRNVASVDPISRWPPCL